MSLFKFILTLLIFLFLLWLTIVFIRLLLLIIKRLFFRRKASFDDSLVELAFKYGKQVDDKPLMELIEQAKKLISKDPNLLSLSSIWTDIIERVKQFQSKKLQYDFFQYIFTNAKFPNPDKLTNYLKVGHNSHF